MKIVDVVGGSGFIGTRLMRRLISSGDTDAKIIDKVQSRTFPELTLSGDIRSLEQLRREISEGAIIVHLAAEHRDDVRPISLYDEVNIEGAKNLCSVAREKNVTKIIFTSSVAVYGFAPIGTDESGEIRYFNDYGRTKYEAEKIFKCWQSESPEERTLVIIRPTVVFGEQNRGNVFNLIKQIHSRRFIMIGSGKNRKSIAYVENVAAFIQHSMSFSPGIHVYNYVDKPDFDMNEFVSIVRRNIGIKEDVRVRLPYIFGFFIGKLLDCISVITRKKFAISAVRVRKFCSDSVFGSSVFDTGFSPPVAALEALEKTIRYEFLENNDGAPLFYTE